MKTDSPLELSSVLKLFAQLFSRRGIAQWVQAQKREKGVKKGRPGSSSAPRSRAGPRGFYERIFSLPVTLWYLVFQRLNADHTQSAVVKDLIAGGADRLSPSPKKPLSQRITSRQTSSYNEARQRLPLDFIQWALGQVGEHVQGWLSAGRAAGRRFQLIDGSTLPMLANPSLERAYPPARNKKGRSDWCLMRVVVGFCALSGVVLSAAEGSVLVSEQALAWQMMASALAGTAWIGDRNFGVWSVVAQAFFNRQDVIVRLTRARARRLTRNRRWHNGQDEGVIWKRTRHDQAAPGTEKEHEVPGRLIFVRVRREGKYIDLWLFTTLLDKQEFSIERLVQLYGLRWQVELNFRYLKTSLEMEQLFVNSPAMARKEFYAGLIAYSLVRVVMAAAASEDAQQRGLSFSQVRQVLVLWFQKWGRDWRSRRGSMAEQIQRLVVEAQKQTLPKRRKPRRSEPRRVRHRRLKFPPLMGSRAAARKAKK